MADKETKVAPVLREDVAKSYTDKDGVEQSRFMIKRGGKTLIDIPGPVLLTVPTLLDARALAADFRTTVTDHATGNKVKLKGERAALYRWHRGHYFESGIRGFAAGEAASGVTYTTESFQQLVDNGSGPVQLNAADLLAALEGVTPEDTIQVLRNLGVRIA